MAELKSKSTVSTDDLKALVKYTFPYDKYDDSDLIVAVNGKVWQIKQGEEVEIPLYVVKAIENSNRQNIAARDYITKNSSK